MTTAPDAEQPVDKPPRAFPRFLPALRAVWPWLLLAVVAFVGWKELREVDFLKVRDLGLGDRKALTPGWLAAERRCSCAGAHAHLSLARFEVRR